MACPHDLHLPYLGRQRSAFGHLQLQPHEIQAGHHLGHRMLDLKPGVHLQEVEAVLAVHHELHRADADVVDRSAGRDRRRTEALAQVGVDDGRRALLDQLLIAALHRTVPLAQIDDLAKCISDDLHLDVPGPLDVALGEQRGVAE